MLKNSIQAPFEVYAASLLIPLQPLIIQVGVKSEKKGHNFKPALLSPPKGPPRVLFCWHHCRDLASQSLPCSTIPLSLLPALMMSHTIWFSAVSSRKRDLAGGEEKERKGGGLKRGAGRTQKTKGSLFLLCVLWVEGREREERGGSRGWEGKGALCEANEERPGSRDHAPDSHVLHRRRLEWPTHKHIFAEIHTLKQSHITTL